MDTSDDDDDEDSNVDKEIMQAEETHDSDTQASVALVGSDASISLAEWEMLNFDEEEDDDEYDNPNADVGLTEFAVSSLQDIEPTREHLRRSHAATSKFEDPEWKAYWYEKRWGKQKRTARQKKQSASLAQQRRLEERLQHQLSLQSSSSLAQSHQPPPPPQSSSSSSAALLAPLANLTADEMKDAIVEYVMANQKRAASRRAWAAAQQEARQKRQRMQHHHDHQKQQQPQSLGTLLPQDLNNGTSPTATSFVTGTTDHPLDRDALLQVNQTALQLRREARAARARRAYQTRMQRQQEQQESTEKTAKGDKKRGRARSKSVAASGDKEPAVLMPISFPATDSYYDDYDDVSLDHLPPAEILKRIEQLVQDDRLPPSRWVSHIIPPTRLARRKDVLLVVLKALGCRGKQQLPGMEEPAFLTQLSVSELGKACVVLLQQREAKEQVLQQQQVEGEAMVKSAQR